MLRFFYNLLFPFVFLVMIPSFLLRMVRRGNYRHKFGQRFGIYSERVRRRLAARSHWTWIHAVSVGEVMIALKLIAAMKKRNPQIGIVLSTTTSTGFRLAREHASDSLEVIYNPIDFLPFVSSAFRVIRPEALILVEAEVWPNIMAQARRLGIPRILVNARLSFRSERRYRLVRPLTRSLFNQLEVLCLQEEGDMARWQGLGISPEKLVLTGSIKFDSESAPQDTPRDFSSVLAEMGVAAGTPVLLGASTFDGEELLLANTLRSLRKIYPDIFLILVPRHAERGAAVAQALTQAGFRVRLRQGSAEEISSPEIYIANTTGELRDWLRCATVVFVGKSLSPVGKGGQNPAEPLTAGAAVVFGNNMQNFATLARQLVQAGAARQVSDAPSLEAAIAELLASPARCAEMLAHGREVLASHDGATRRTVDIIEQSLALSRAK